MASKSLYVGNLPHGTNEEELKELFAAWDPTDIRLIRDKGFGFVDVTDEKAAEAIAAMNGKDYKGRPLTVNEARPRGERTGGDRRGGGGFGGGGGRGGGGGGRSGPRRW
jgi:cold-inducible RNA-binding protein